mgnify:CR=1 FL=1|tara:strand:- start:32183 stop:33940 length:1758 start_codon:yes stop_codon:yes gene_type:complete
MSTLDADWVDAGAVPEIVADEPISITAGTRDLVLVRSASGMSVFEGRCPHQGALLGEGELANGLLICRNHRWKFDSETGERKGGKACLKRFEHRVRDGRLEVFLDDTASLEQEPVVDKEKLRVPEDLPGPKGSLVLGNAKQIDPEHFHNNLEAWAEEFGTPYTFRLANQRLVAFSDPQVIAQVLRERPDTFRRARRVQPIFDELGIDGVFSAEGDAWRPQRKLAIAALSHRNLKNFYDGLAQMAERLRQRWLRVADTGRVLNIQDDLMRFTVDVTTMLTFGHDANTLEKGSDVIQRHMEKVFPALSRRLQSPVPYWRLLKLAKDRDVDKAIASLRSWLAPIVEETRARLKANPELAKSPTNFLESMLSSRDENGQPFSEERIFGNALTMLLAGEDTTANTLAWAVHELLDRPESVTRFREELDETLGTHAVPPDRETAQGLAFATAIANETMRLRPVAPLLLADANKDVVLDNIRITPKTAIVLLIRTAALDDAVMPNGKSFIPERWLDPSTAEAAQQKLVHLPFGSGPRICPGRSLALLELNLVLSVLYKNFEVERVGKSADVEEVFSFTMVPTNLRVKLRRRR